MHKEELLVFFNYQLILHKELYSLDPAKMHLSSKNNIISTQIRNLAIQQIGQIYSIIEELQTNSIFINSAITSFKNTYLEECKWLLKLTNLLKEKKKYKLPQLPDLPEDIGLSSPEFNNFIQRINDEIDILAKESLNQKSENEVFYIEDPSDFILDRMAKKKSIITN